MRRKIVRAWRRRFARKQYVDKSGVAYHRHENGGGWVANSANVSADAFVHRRAMVGPHATVGIGCKLHSGVRIGVLVILGSFTHLRRGVVFGDGSIAGYRCSIGWRTKIGHSTELGNWVTVGRCSQLCAHVGLGDGSTYGNGFSAAEGRKGSANEYFPGYGYRLGVGYPRWDPSMTLVPW